MESPPEYDNGFPGESDRFPGGLDVEPGL